MIGSSRFTTELLDDSDDFDELDKIEILEELETLEIATTLFDDLDEPIKLDATDIAELLEATVLDREELIADELTNDDEDFISINEDAGDELTSLDFTVLVELEALPDESAPPQPLSVINTEAMNVIWRKCCITTQTSIHIQKN